MQKRTHNEVERSFGDRYKGSSRANPSAMKVRARSGGGAVMQKAGPAGTHHGIPDPHAATRRAVC